MIEIKVWAIRSPSGPFPYHYAVRAHVLEGGRFHDVGECALYPALEDAREALLKKGLMCIPPNPRDDPAVLELWL